MSRVKRAKGYICSDGKVFETKFLAERHQEQVDLVEVLVRCLDFYQPNDEIDAKGIAAKVAEKLPTFIVGKIKLKFPEDNDE